MARAFSGTSYLFTEPLVPALGPAAPLTLACWFRPTDVAGGTSKTLICLENNPKTQYVMLRSVGGTGQASALVSNGSATGVATTGGGATSGAWAHYGAVFLSNASRLAYLNGIVSSPDTVTVSPDPVIDVIKCGYLWSALQTAIGDLAEVGIWTAALTADEMAALARGVSPLLIRPAARVGSWPLDGAESAWERDRWRNRLDLQVQNAPIAAHVRVFSPWHTLVEDAPIAAIRFQAAPAISLAAAGTLTAPVRFAAAAALALAVTGANLTAPPAPMQATAGVTIGSTASLTAPARFAAVAGLRVSASASFLPTTMGGAAGITIGTRATLLPNPRETVVGITIDGGDVTGRVRMKGVTVHDILNDAPNTCALVVEGVAPVVGQRLRVTLNDGNVVLFAGQVQAVDQSYKVNPSKPAWAVTAIDDTAKANAKRPFGTFVDVSASTIAQTITTSFAPSFSTAGIEAGLPTIRIVFDGADTFIACLTRLATAVGGYCKIEDGVVYLFQTDTSAPPDPIDDGHCFMFDPPIRANVDSSQLRTRVYGKGYGENIQADLAVGETLIPIENGTQFQATGGLAIASTTPDGAQSERLAYTGVSLQAGGTLVGTGAGPTTAPGVNLQPGTGVETGTHEYAIVFGTAAGKSLPGPRVAIAVGLVPAPSTAPAAGAAVTGPGPDSGSHRYYAVFRTAAGKTTPGPVSNSVTTSAAIAAPVLPSPALSPVPGTGLTLGAGYVYYISFRRASDGAETTATYASSANLDASNPSYQCIGARVITPPPGYQMILYRGAANEVPTLGTLREIQTPTLEGPFPDGYMYLVDHNESRKANAPPTSNTTAIGSVPLTAIPISPHGATTNVDLYREFNNAGAATAKLALSVTNGTTTATDTIPNSSLGAVVPATNTAAANRVYVTWPAAPSSVTAIEAYRTPIGSSQLKLLNSAASNASGAIFDSTPDASLGANAPTGDTSGLTQPQGQVNPGAVALPVASSLPFRSGGGWAQLAGDQYVRYTGMSGNSLTGIPATGAGAITTTVVYGSPALPAAMLLGVTGVTVPIRKGSPIHIWVQRDDLAAQAEQAARAGGDGVVEFLIVDMRRGAPSLIARCDAELALFARPIVTVAYTTRDLKTKSGKDVVIDLTSPAIHETLTIQDVTITDIDTVPGVPPRFSVQASSVRFSLEDTLRRLIAGGLIVGGSS